MDMGLVQMKELKQILKQLKMHQINLLLRGVEYNDIRIEPERNSIGLIAQEVELIIPEVVRTSEEDGLKKIEYQNLVDLSLLIEAIKEQKKQIIELKKINKK